MFEEVNSRVVDQPRSLDLCGPMTEIEKACQVMIGHANMELTSGRKNGENGKE